MFIDKSFAVVGAGVAGLNAARLLQEQGHRVQVFEKSRGRGGRMATRRGEFGGFDHGAQFFTARDAGFTALVNDWCTSGTVSTWQGRFARQLEDGSFEGIQDPRWYVAQPGMSGLGRALADGLDVHTQLRVQNVLRQGRQWRLRDDAGQDVGLFDGLIIAAPAPQAAVLLEPLSANFAAKARSVQYAPCWAAMLGSRDESAHLGWPYDGCQLSHGPLSWVARNSAKPGRSGNETWVLHASPEWSRAHVEDARADVMQALIHAFAELTGVSLHAFDHRDAHRWLYALVENPLADEALWDEALRLGACGDWCKGPRIEDAWLSGLVLAAQVQQSG